MSVKVVKVGWVKRSETQRKPYTVLINCLGKVIPATRQDGISRYLDSFETPTGFCLVQEYKNAQSLSVTRSFDPDEIKHIAVSVLSILVYLQKRIPPVIHRDIKPENILVDDELKVYLVDFGLARIGSGSVAMSSADAGTFGFMPPEQLHNLQLTKASDLYGLGATLICLVTRTKSTEIGKLVNLGTNRINFQHLLPELSFRFMEWLEQMLEPDPQHRFPHAKAALEALKPLYVVRVPEVKLSQSKLEFKATKLGKKLTQTITVSNSIPETVLEGCCEVAPHPSDPPHTPDSYAWISLTPKRFKGNSVKCRITIDTSQLKADKVYQRKIFLHTNSRAKICPLNIKIKTALIPIKTQNLSYLILVFRLLGLIFVMSWITFSLFDAEPST